MIFLTYYLKKLDIINSKRERNSKLVQSFRDNQNTGRQEEQVQTQAGIDLARLDPNQREWFTNEYEGRQRKNKIWGQNFNGSYGNIKRNGGRISKMC